MKETLATMNYVSVVYRDTVCLASVISALDELDVNYGDVWNAYITAPIEEKVWTAFGPEFGNDVGKRALIVRALCGLRSAGAAFCAHLGSCMQGLEHCLSDPDLWKKSVVISDDKYEHYSYILCYVDDIMVIHNDSLSILKKIDR